MRKEDLFMVELRKEGLGSRAYNVMKNYSMRKPSNKDFPSVFEILGELGISENDMTTKDFKKAVALFAERHPLGLGALLGRNCGPITVMAIKQWLEGGTPTLDKKGTFTKEKLKRYTKEVYTDINITKAIALLKANGYEVFKK